MRKDTVRKLGIGTVAVIGTASVIGFSLAVGNTGAPRMGSEAAEAYNAQVFPESVEYYRAVCPQIGRIADVADTVSVSLEDSVGSPDAAQIRIDGLRNSADTLRDAANILGGVPAPTEVFNASGPVDYTGAAQPLIDASNRWADGLGEVETLIQNENTDEADTRQPQVMTQGSSEVSDALSSMLGAATISNAATRDEIAKQPGCETLFKDSPTPAPTQVIEPAADFHARLGKAAELVTAGTAPLRDLPDMEDKPMLEAVGILRDGWLSRADSAANAVRILEGWHMPPDPDPVTAASLEGYDQAHHDAIDAYRNIEQQARSAVDFLNGVNETTDPQSVDEFLVKASEDASHASVEEAKLHIRTSRIAPLPNTATSNAVDRIQQTLAP